jgi:hypothetical protein
MEAGGQVIRGLMEKQMYQLDGLKANRKFNGDTDRQSDRVLKRLMQERPDKEGVRYGRVSSLHLSRDTGALQYCRCLNDLAKDGWVVKNELDYPEGKKIGYFRLIGWVPPIDHEQKVTAGSAGISSLAATGTASMFAEPMRSWNGDA